MTLKEDWDNDSQTRNLLPQALNDAAVAINALPDTYVTLGTNQEITGDKIFTEPVIVGDPDGIHTHVLTDSVQVWGNLSASTLIDAGALSLAPRISNSSFPARFTMIDFGASYWDGVNQGVSPGLLKYQPNSGSPYFEFDKPVNATGYLGVTAVGGVTGYADLEPGYLNLSSFDATALILERASQIQLDSRWWNGSGSAATTGTMTLKPDAGQPYFEFNKKIRTSNINDGFEAFLGGAGDYEGGYTAIWPGRIEAAGRPSTAESPYRRGSLYLQSTYWTGSLSHTDGGSIYYDAENSYFAFDSDVFLNSLIVGVARFGGTEVDFGVTDIDVNGPFIQAAYATSGFPSRPARLKMRAHYWNGSNNVRRDGNIFFQPNGGFPYFEFDQSVLVPTLQVGDFYDSVLENGEYTGAYLSLSAALAEVGTPNIPVQIAFYPTWWNGSTSQLAGGNLYLQPNAGSPYFEFDQPVSVTGYLNVNAVGGVTGFADLEPGYLDLSSFDATALVPEQASQIQLDSRWWNGSSTTTTGTVTLKPNSGSPYFEFDKSVHVLGKFEVGSQVLTSPSSNSCQLNMTAHWYDSTDHGETGVIYFDANFGDDPSFKFDHPVSVSGALGLPTRLVGGTASGAPATGTFQVRDIVVTTDGHIWVCTTAGTPGTWRDLG